MPNRIDLHTHTTFSDGTLTPSELVTLAVRNNLKMLSITDHDTVEGIPEAISTASKLTNSELAFLPGVEISAHHRHELHILGYFSNDNYRNIAPFLDNLLIARDTRNHRVIEKLRTLGIKIDICDVESIAGKKIFGRPHIAALLKERGYSSSIKAAFDEYIGRGRKAYVTKEAPSPARCVKEISLAGGLAVIAHPALIGISLHELRELAGSLIPHGLRGLETYYPLNTPAITRNHKELADSLGILSTGGSDFHGDYRKSIELGSGKNGSLVVPDSLLAIISGLLSLEPV